MYVATTPAGHAPNPLGFAADSSRLTHNETDPGIQNLRQTIRSRLVSALEVRPGESVVDLPDLGQCAPANHSFDVVLADIDALHHAGPREVAAELFRLCRFGGRIGLACPTPWSLLARIRKTISAYVSPSSVATYAAFDGTRENLNEWFGSGAIVLGAAARVVWLDYSSAEHWLASWVSSYRPLKFSFRLVEPDCRDQLSDDLMRLARSFAMPVKGALRIRCDYLEYLAYKGIPQ
jgi:SAM-dependent methyltransferase